MPYYVIENVDGDTFVQEVTRDEVIEMARGLYEMEEKSLRLLMEEIPNKDTNYWPRDSKIIIHGEIVVPEPFVEQITWHLTDEL